MRDKRKARETLRYLADRSYLKDGKIFIFTHTPLPEDTTKNGKPSG